MAYSLNRNLSGTVEQASILAAELIAIAEQKIGGKDEATRALSAQCRLPYSFMRALAQPSRRPKAISATYWFRLYDGYLAYCRTQIRELEQQVERVERLGIADQHAADLVDKGQALVDRLKRHL